MTFRRFRRAAATDRIDRNSVTSRKVHLIGRLAGEGCMGKDRVVLLDVEGDQLLQHGEGVELVQEEAAALERTRPGSMMEFEKLTSTCASTQARHHAVSPCAMRVKRDREPGPMTPYSPSSACGCYYEKMANGSTACTPCTRTSDCPSQTSTCSFGYCEPVW